MKRGIVCLAATAVLLFTAAPAHATGCSPTQGVWGKVATLYKKVTGSELIYCP